MPSRVDLEILISVAYFAGLLVLIGRAAATIYRSRSQPAREGFTSALLTLIWLLPLLLLIDPNAHFRADYVAHAGQTAATSNMIRAGAWLPHATNTIQLVGDPTISIAGRWHLLVTGYAAILVGAPLAVRFLILTVTLLQVKTLYRSARTLGAGQWAALAITATSYWSTYSLNNLYNRGAVAEFLATSLVVSAMSLLIIWWKAESREQSIAAFCGLAVVIAGFTFTHPLTGINGSAVLMVEALALALIYGLSARRLALVAGGALLVVVMLSPWLCLLLLHPPSESAIASTFSLRRFAGLDEAWLRLLPLPLNRMPLEYGHPYFVTQASTLLLPLGIVLLSTRSAAVPAGRRGRYWALMLGIAALAAFVFYISLNESLDEFLPNFIKTLQYAYRLVAPLNNLMLLLVLLGIAAVPRPDLSGLQKRLLTGIVAVALLGVFINLYKSSPEVVFTKFGAGNGLLHKALVPPYPYLRVLPDASDLEKFDLSNGCSYAQVRAANDGIRCTTEWVDLRFDPRSGHAIASGKEPSGPWLTTNIVYYPWNRLYLDGHEVPGEPFQNFLRIPYRADWQSLRYKLVPEKIYVFLDGLSVLLAGALLAIALVTHARLRKPALGGVS